MPPIQREWTIGENVIQFEPPDLLRVQFRGPCALKEAIQLVEICQELGTVHPFFILGDMGAAGKLSAEARQHFSEHFQLEWVQGLVYYNMRLLHKAIIMGLSLAIQLVRPEASSLQGKLYFAPTQEKAEAILDELRPPRK